MSGLTKEDIQEITLAVMAANEAANSQHHQQDHEFIKLLRIREENKQKLYNAVITHVSKAGALGIFTGILWCIWLVFKQKLIG